MRDSDAHFTLQRGLKMMMPALTNFNPLMHNVPKWSFWDIMH